MKTSKTQVLILGLLLASLSLNVLSCANHETDEKEKFIEYLNQLNETKTKIDDPNLNLTSNMTEEEEFISNNTLNFLEEAEGIFNSVNSEIEEFVQNVSESRSLSSEEKDSYSGYYSKYSSNNTKQHKEIRKAKEELKELTERAKQQSGGDRTETLDKLKEIDSYVTGKLRELCRNRQDFKEKSKMAVDLAFLVDVTGSMDSYIRSVKEKVGLLVHQIKQQYNLAKIRLAFVGYRDFEDNDPFEILQFTNDEDKFTRFVSTVDAKQGCCRLAENVNGGLQKALESIEWISTNRLLIHLGDQPDHEFGGEGLWQPHKKNFTLLFDDLVPRNISYVFFEITPHTRSMIKEFKSLHAGAKEAADVMGNATLSTFHVAELKGSPRQFGQILDNILRTSMQYDRESGEESVICRQINKETTQTASE